MYNNMMVDSPLSFSSVLKPHQLFRVGFLLFPGRANLLSSFGGLSVVLSEILVVLDQTAPFFGPAAQAADGDQVEAHSPGLHTAARLGYFPPLLPVFEFHFLEILRSSGGKKGRVWRGNSGSPFLTLCFEAICCPLNKPQAPHNPKLTRPLSQRSIHIWTVVTSVLE